MKSKAHPENRVTVQDLPSELLKMVLEELNPPFGWHGLGLYKGTLAAASAVCKAWCTIALDELWSNMESLRPLLRLLPGYQADGTWNNLDAYNWSRFDGYARRIRSFERGNEPSINALVLMRLNLLRPGTLLPNLRYLSIYDLSPQQTPELFCCVSPSIRGVEISFGITRVDATEMLLLQTILEQTTLETLAMELYSVAFSTPVLCAMASMKTLRKISIVGNSDCAVDAAFLSALSRLTALQSLHLDLEPKVSTGIDMQVNSGFSASTKLSFGGDLIDVVDVLEWVAQTNPPALTAIELSFCYSEYKDELASGPWALPPHASHWKHILESCAVFAGLHNLQLKYPQECHRAMESDSPIRSLIIDGLKNLTTLQELRCLRFDNFPAIQITEEDVERVARWFPQLETLQLPPTKSNTIGINSLIALAKNCPSLCNLKIDVRFDEGISGAQGSIPIMDHHLQFLELYSSEFDQPEAQVARYIDMLFPRLSQSDANGISTEIDALLKEWRRVRRDHEMRLGVQV